MVLSAVRTYTYNPVMVVICMRANGGQSSEEVRAKVPRLTCRPEVKLILRELYSQRSWLVSNWKVRTNCSLLRTTETRDSLAACGSVSRWMTYLV